MRKEVSAVIAALLMMVPLGAQTQDPLAAAKGLYAAADYEGALGALEEARAAAPLAPEVRLGLEQYRALCLLAMGRKGDAEKAIEAVLDLDPFYEPREDDAAPWVRAAFREVRARVLPGTLQQLYGRGKQAFERKDYAEARNSFGQVMRVLDDPALPLDKGAQADMRLVVSGFLDLAEAASSIQLQAAAAAPQTAAAPAPPPVGSDKAAGPPPVGARANDATAGPPAGAAPEPSPAAQAADTIYDATATDVVPPLPLRQAVDLPETLRPSSESAGVVEIVIAADGAVESAKVTQSFGQVLDRFVQQAVTGWRYRAALRAGKPVRYRRLVRIILPGRRGGTDN